MDKKSKSLQPSPRPLTRSVFSLIHSLLQIVVCPIFKYLMEQHAIKYIDDDKGPSSPNGHNNSTKSFNSPDSVTLPPGASAKSPVSRRRLNQLENELTKLLAIVSDLLEEREKISAKLDHLGKQVDELKEENLTIRAQLEHLSNGQNGENSANDEDDVDALSVSALCARIRERCEQFDEEISNGTTALTLQNGQETRSNQQPIGHRVHFESSSHSTCDVNKDTPKETKFHFDQFTPYVVIESEVSDNSCSTATVAGEEATEILPIDRSLERSFDKNKTSTPSLGERLKTYARKIVTRNSSSSCNSSAFEAKYLYIGDSLDPPLSARNSIEGYNCKNDHNSTFTK